MERQSSNSRATQRNSQNTKYSNRNGHYNQSNNASRNNAPSQDQYLSSSNSYQENHSNNDNYTDGRNYNRYRDDEANQMASNEQPNNRSNYNNRNYRNNNGYSNRPNSDKVDLPPRFSRMNNYSNRPNTASADLNRNRQKQTANQNTNLRENDEPKRDELPHSFNNAPRASSQHHSNNNHSNRQNYNQNSNFRENFDEQKHDELSNSFNGQLRVSLRHQQPNNNHSNRLNQFDQFDQPSQSSKRNINSNYNLQPANGQRNHRNHAYNYRNNYKSEKDKKNESQREIMDELLRKAKYECIVCCESIKISQKTWNCSNCFNVFHLKCIQTWARTSNATETASNPTNANGASGSSGTNQTSGNNRRQNRQQQTNNDWRCPTCQNIEKKFPYAYYCFCGKVKEPELSNYHVPHSCGETCSRPLNLFNKTDQESSELFPCGHKCTLMCHPGKCPPCSSKIERTCACSKTKTIMNCVSEISELKCDEVCSKPLNCGKHYCEKKCHYGDCGSCQNVFDLKCFCGKETKTDLACTNTVELFTCEQKCSKLLACGFHTCTNLCHPGDCGTCPFDPATVKSCPCGNTSIGDILGNKKRLLCLDPIPVCYKICKKRLTCGSDSDPHYCKSLCHSASCPPCLLTSILRCECGANSQKFECKDITSDRFRCKRRCNKKLSCGRHKCLNECCTDKEHICRGVCGRKLECGTHTCSEPCHSYCKSCPNVIWTEVHCNCGAQVLYPPLPCGTKKPPCDKLCARVHSCSHPPTHQCHDDPECPPCTAFVSIMCYGGHEICNTVPCYQSLVSCGRFCMKPLACSIHNCVKVCHPGQCPACTQRCTKPRQGCEHQCGLPCHQSASSNCPESKCKELVKVYCKCKLKVEEMQCFEVNDPRKFQASMESMIKRFSFNTAVSLDEVKQMVLYNLLHQLDCDDKCSKEKRNKDLAEALGIEGHSETPSIKYTDSLKNEARSNPHIVLNIHDKLVMLLENYKKSNAKTMNYNFPPMNRNSREIIHNYAAYFGCKTDSVDREPNRSVIVTAVKTSSIPEISLLEAANVDVNQLRPKQSVVKVKLSSEENKDKKETIDYFNFDGQD